MTEELFCKLFPEYSVNGKPLSPYFDLFERGYEQAEERIEELEKENAELKKLKRECETSLCRAEYQYNYEQLTKATELLRKLVLEVTGYEEINGYDTCEPVQEAEQFLREVEK